MEMTPQTVASATFKIVRKGFDPNEVHEFLSQVSTTLESSQQQSAAMEARARAAMAKLQEAQQGAQPAQPTASNAHDTETISRTLLLAQRTADLTITDAKQQASSIVDAATAEASTIRSSAVAEAATALEAARASAAQLVEAARSEARRTRDEEHLKAEGEVQSLLARRDFLLADVEQLEQHLVAQRDRLREASTALINLAERVPGGLGEMRRPLMSASDVRSTSPVGDPTPAEPREATQTSLYDAAIDDTEGAERPLS